MPHLEGPVAVLTKSNSRISLRDDTNSTDKRNDSSSQRSRSRANDSTVSVSITSKRSNYDSTEEINYIGEEQKIKNLNSFISRTKNNVPRDKKFI